MEDQDDEYQAQMREELSHVPLGELKAMQEKLGLKAFKKMKTGNNSKASIGASFKRLNKHRPAEFSARKPVPRQTLAIKEKTRRDPRFDDLSGEFDQDIFKKSYDFLDEIKANEKQKLKTMMEETTNKQKKAQIKELYKRMEQREKAEKRREAQRKIEQEWKNKEEEKVKEGKKPFYLKKSEKKLRLQEIHKKELEEKGQLQKYTERKNKKLAAKEKKSQTWTVDEDEGL